VAREDLLTVKADVVLPSARTWSITEDLAARIQTRGIVPAANAPYGPRAAEILHLRGVVCLPGYLCNVGGVLGTSLADSGVPIPEVEGVFRRSYRPLLWILLERCRGAGLCPVSVADELAMREISARSAAPAATRAQRVAARLMARHAPRLVRREMRRRECERVFERLRSDFAGAASGPGSRAA
jgi:glutamate dehydrogenase (NAD(P)+)